MFPTAEAARILSTGSNSYEVLISRAFDAIMAATRNGLSMAEIPYEDVQPADHTNFHNFIVGQGFRGGKSHLPPNRYVYRIYW